jgi:hypothetical protein
VVLALLATADACGGNSRSVTVGVRLPPSAVVTDNLDLDPASSLQSVTMHGSELTVALSQAVGRVTLRVQGACPVTIDPAGQRDGSVVTAAPWLDLGGDRGQVGFDAPFQIDVVPGCAEAASGRIEWKQIEGPPLLDWGVDPSGFHAHGRTRPYADVHGAPVAWGISPTSPRTQGRYVLEATWHGAGKPQRATVLITSIARATGVPSLSVNQRVVLGGVGWHVTKGPNGARAQVRAEGDRTTFEPDASGRWVLEDGAGAKLAVRVGRYDRTPLDCGRDECHRSDAEVAASSPMTHALQKHIEAPDEARPDVSCMLDCHVEGQRGLKDGGFLDLESQLGQSPSSLPHAWDELPRSLRRVGGVGCAGCHGPAAIPERDVREAILSADVCAACHDAPPSYVHVEQWRGSRMARSDVQSATRDRPTCARCHTTSGFLESIGVWKPSDIHSDPAGIACAACHAPHGPHDGDALVRRVALPAGFDPNSEGQRASALCIGCHSPGRSETIPSASAAILWRGGVGAPSSPHAAVPGGCLGCHGGERSPTNHSFHVQSSYCKGCHPGATPEEHADEDGKRVHERALLLWGQLARRVGLSAAQTDPIHAREVVLKAGTSPSLIQALYDVALVVEDPAAGIHNAPYARELLDEAARALTF